MKRVFLIMIVLLYCIFSTKATDFTVESEEYTIKDAVNKKVELTVSYRSGSFNIPSSVTYKNIPYSVTSIGAGAFAHTDISSVSMPSSITSIGTYAFYDCNWLSSVVISSSVDSIKYKTFDCCAKLESVTLPNSIKYIGHFAFEACAALSSISLPSSLTYIEDEAFYWAGLKSLTIPSSVSYIGQCAFQCCPITSLNFITPSSLKSFGWGAFLGTELTSVTIPPSVITIADATFYQCYHLSSVDIPSSVTSIGDNVFTYCGELTSINVDNNNPNYSSNDGILFNKDKTILIKYPSGKINTSYKIPNSVIFIGEGAFAQSINLNSVIFPISITSIGYAAFYYCTNLTSVTLPSSITSIGTMAFQYCSYLTSFHIQKKDPVNIILTGIPFSDFIYSTCTLYVPIGSKPLYISDFNWSSFTNIIEEDVNNGIETVSASELGIGIVDNKLYLSSVLIGMPIQIISTNGRLIYNAKAIDSSFSTPILDAGMYVVKVGNKVAKVVVN